MYIVIFFDLSGPTCLLNSLLKFSSPGENGVFGIKLCSPKQGCELLKSRICFSVGNIVSARQSSWHDVCKNFRTGRPILESSKNATSQSNDYNTSEDVETKNPTNKEKSPKVAFFDVDGTITRTNVVLAYYTHRITELPFIIRLLWVPWFAITCIFYLIVDSVNRAVFNRIFYLSYRGRPVQSKTKMADSIYKKYYRPR